jgi:hypothetical protein
MKKIKKEEKRKRKNLLLDSL